MRIRQQIVENISFCLLLAWVRSWVISGRTLTFFEVNELLSRRCGWV